MSTQTVTGNLPLFRNEALERFRGTAWQPPLLSNPVSPWVLATLSPARRRRLHCIRYHLRVCPQGAGTGLPDTSRRLVPGHGQIVRRRSPPIGKPGGTPCVPGDVLLEISPGDGVQQALTVQDRMLEEIQGRRTALDERIRLISREYEQQAALLKRAGEADRRELERLEEEIELSHVRARIARQRYQDAERLADSGALTRAETMRLEDELQTRLLVLSERSRAADRLRVSLAGNVTRLAELEINRDLNTTAVREQAHALAMEESRIRGEGAHRVLAPRNGTVASVRVDAGDGAQPGQVLLDIVPPGSALQGRLFVPSVAMGFVKPGQEVRVYLDSFPYERHGAQTGRVRSVSATALSQGEAVLRQVQSGALYRVDVEFPHGFTLSPAQLQALRPGMTVTADLVRDYGTLVDWIMEPLQGAARRL